MNLVFEIGFFSAAFVPTFLVSRIIFRLTKPWEGSLKRLVLTNLASGLICIAIFAGSGAVLAQGFDFPWLFGVLNFAIAQAIWLGVDIYSDWINRKLGTQPD